MDEQSEDQLAELQERYRQLSEAHQARGRLLSKQRWQFTERLQEETEERDLELGRLRAEVERLQAEVEGRREELQRLQRTKILRYTAPLRGLWGRIRGRG